MPQQLTDNSVKSLKPRDKQYEVFCSNPTGFGIRVNPGGSKAWFFMYTDGAGKRQRAPIGKYPALSLKVAREIAKQKSGDIAKGGDPAKEKRHERRLQAKAEMGMDVSTPVTMKDCMEQFIANRVRVNYKPANKADGTQVWEAEQLIRKHIIPRIGDINIVEFRRGDAKAMQRAITEKSGARVAERAAQTTRAALNWLADEEIIEDAPTFRFKSERVKRTRVLRDGEIRTLWHACDAAPLMYGSYLKMLLLTAQRRTEVATMRWDDINETDQTWTTKVKSAKSEEIEVVVPLSTLAQRVLDALPRQDGSDYVFPKQRGNGPFKAHTITKKIVDKHLDGALGDWRFHDLRRTCRTNLPRLKVLPDVAEAVIGHKKQGLDAVYNQYEYLDEKREALQKWADLIAEIVTPTDDEGKVVHLRPVSA